MLLERGHQALVILGVSEVASSRASGESPLASRVTMRLVVGLRPEFSSCESVGASWSKVPHMWVSLPQVFL